MCWVLGFLLSPFSILVGGVLLSTAICSRWTMVGHHVMHGGYSHNTDKNGRFHRFNFAKGIKRRVADWLDWMLPEAWNVEHNKLHHYQLGEDGDPDLVQRNMVDIRNFNKAGVPVIFLYPIVAFFAFTWKWMYYMPNTLKEYEKSQLDNKGKKNQKSKWGHLGDKPALLTSVLEGVLYGNAGMLFDYIACMAPYAMFMFGVIPGVAYLLFGKERAQTALYTTIFAELLTNVHSFIIIACNHAGDDVYRFDTPVQPKSSEFLLRAVIGSVNFHTGSDFGTPGTFVPDLVDFLQGWLNYQIEHHMFPDMSMLQYQKAAPKIRAICEKHGVPYVQGPCWVRSVKLAKIMVGEETMRHWDIGE